MAKTEEIPTSSDDTLLALVTSIKSLTLALEANTAAASAPQASQTPLPVTTPADDTPAAAAVSTAADDALVSTPASTATDDVPVATPVSTATVLASIPAFGELTAVYLTPRARSSRGVHPAILNILPDMVSAPELGTWYVVTVGRYTGIYQECHQVSPIVSGWSGACYKQHSTKTGALEAYDGAWIQGAVHGGVHPDQQL